MLRATALATLLVAVAAPLFAQDEPPEPNLADPVTLRRNMMEQVGASAKLGGDMLKGETEFEPRVAEAALRTLHAAALGFGAQFAEGTDFGHDTDAAPSIWQDREGFDEALAKFISDTRAAVQADVSSRESFQRAFQQVAGNCKECHESFRIRD